ncbi:hypothetical protein BDB01DRAFT_367634 [Pilobolus umbonatus]|nr:hypothetical protein BDB01DRAFT_367634 [Pilobolus umbonatus]
MSLPINTKGTAATIISDKISHKRYITVWDRTTQYDDGRIVKWDIVGHDTPYPTFVVVFTYNTEKKTTCLLKEYAQGTNEIKYTCVAGSYDRRKHSSVQEAAEHELSEEARLKGGHWISLLPPNQPQGISELKWGRNRFVPYLCLNPTIDNHPKLRDEEEYMEIEHNIRLSDLKDFIMQGEVMLPSVQTAWMAMHYLENHQLI